MTQTPGWGHSPPPSPPPPGYPPSSSDGHDPPINGNAYMMLGQLFEQGRHILWRVEKIDGRLDQGSQRFERVEDRVDRLEAAHRRGRDEIPRWERTIKRWAAWLIPAAVFAGTGQFAAALQWAKLLK